MKKLIISLAVGFAAFALNAAAVSWSSGTASNGFFGPDGNSMVGNDAFTMSVYFYSDAGQTLVTSDSISAPKGNGAYSHDTPYEDFAADTTYYMKAIISGTVDETTWTREADLASFTTLEQGKSSINLTTGGGFGSEGMKWGEWTSTPEPTSGLLVLLGMAGLMLRRKRA